MEKIVKQSLLFDFYGKLLTEHQQNVYQDAVFNDMSLSEVADNYSISRQGVHDLLKRCDKTMEEYEAKLQLITKFSDIKEKLSEITKLSETTEEEVGKQIKLLATDILEEL